MDKVGKDLCMTNYNQKLDYLPIWLMGLKVSRTFFGRVNEHPFHGQFGVKNRVAGF